jgi:ribose/xylose/arabinose/galactoside ABC-type transport system permease subunit
VKQGWNKQMLSEKHLSLLIDNLIWIILVVVFIFFVTQSEYFLTERNISNILTAAAVLGVLVVAETLICPLNQRWVSVLCWVFG